MCVLVREDERVSSTARHKENERLESNPMRDRAAENLITQFVVFLWSVCHFVLPSLCSYTALLLAGKSIIWQFC